MGMIPEDYSGIGLLGSGVQGFIKGMIDVDEYNERKEDRRYKRMEIEAKHMAEKNEKQRKETENKFNQASKLRDDWLKNQTTKNSQTVKESYDKIRSASPSAAGDMSLVFSYMKILDPGSTVREGEYANASNTTGIAGKLYNIYNKVKDGAILNQEQRANFRKEAARLYEAQQNSQRTFDEQFGQLADTYSIPRKEIVLKIFEDPQTGEQKIVPVPAAQAGAPARPTEGLLAPQPKPQGLIKKAAPKKSAAPKAPAVDYDSMSDAELERLYRQKVGGG